MKKWLKYLLIVVFVAVATLAFLYYSKATVTQKELNQYNSSISEGDKYYQIKEYANAIYNYSLASDVIQTKIEAYEGILKVLIEKNQLGQAAEIVDNSIAKLAGLDKARLFLLVGRAYYDQNNMTRAETYYLNSFKAKSNVDAILGLSKTYIRMGASDKALTYLKKVDGVSDAKTLDAAILKSYLALDDIVIAKSYLEDVDVTLIDDDDVLERYNSYLLSLNSAGDDELYKAALLSKEYINAGFPSLAISVLEPRKEEMTEYADGLYLLGRAYFDQGEFTSAVEVLDQAVTLGAYTGEIYQIMALSHIELGDRKLAFDYYEKAIEFGDDDLRLGLIKEYVELLFEEDIFTTAKSYLEKYANLSEDDWASYKYVEMYYGQRDFEKMRYHLDIVADMTEKTDSQKKEAYKWEITYSLENDELTKAEELLADLKKLDRFNPEYYLLFGRVSLAKTDTQTAESAFEKAIDYDLDGEVTTTAKKLLDRIE